MRRIVVISQFPLFVIIFFVWYTLLLVDHFAFIKQI